MPEHLTSVVVTSKNKDNSWFNIPTLASGGLWSTANDMAKFMIQISKGILGELNSFLPQSLFKEILMKNQVSNYGLGFVVDNKNKAMNLRKVGFNKNYYNQMIMFPYTGDGMVIMTNSSQSEKFIQEAINNIAFKHQWPEYNANFNEFN